MFVIHEFLYFEKSKQQLRLNMDKINDFYHRHFGLTKYRPSIGARVDPFFDFLPNQKNEQDNEALRRLTNLIAYTSNVCFKKCINVEYEHFTREEKSCVKSCTDDYFDGFLEMSEEVRKKTVH